jgi:microcystin-dependent protein
VYNAISPAPSAAMNSNAVTQTGGSQPHNNLQPYLALNWIISLFGIYPSKS